MNKQNTDSQSESELPEPDKAFQGAFQAARQHNWLEATGRWAIFRRAYPNHSAPWVQGAIACMGLGQLEKAEQLLDYARKQFPNHPNAVVQSAELAMRRQHWKIAETLLHRAREEFPGFLLTWLKSMELAEQRNDQQQALSYNKEAQRKFPDRMEPFVQYAELSMRAEQWEEALQRWEEFRTRFPDIPAGYLRAAKAARALNRQREARHLTLANQYGSDLLTEDLTDNYTSEKRGSHTRPRQLVELIWTKAIFNLRSEVHRNYLSYGWWVLEPLLHMVVYYVVFGLLLQRGGENYTVFLLTGLIPWMWFSKAVGGSSNSILAGQNLMLQVGLPSVVFPLVSLLQATIKQLPVFVLLLGFVWFQGYVPGAYWWALIPVIIVQALLTIAFACAVAAVIPFVRDLSYLVPTGLMFLMFLSGIFYDYRIISEDWQSLFLLNPIAFLLKCYREIFMDGVLPDLITLSWWGLGSAVACLLLVFAYQRLRYIYPRIVLE